MTLHFTKYWNNQKRLLNHHIMHSYRRQRVMMNHKTLKYLFCKFHFYKMHCTTYTIFLNLDSHNILLNRRRRTKPIQNGAQKKTRQKMWFFCGLWTAATAVLPIDNFQTDENYENKFLDNSKLISAIG